MIVDKVMVLRLPKRILNKNIKEEKNDMDLKFRTRLKVPSLRMIKQELDGLEDLWRAKWIHPTGLFEY